MVQPKSPERLWQLDWQERPVESRRVSPYLCLFQMALAKPHQLEIPLERPSHPVEVFRRVYLCLFRMAKEKSVGQASPPGSLQSPVMQWLAEPRRASPVLCLVRMAPQPKSVGRPSPPGSPQSPVMQPLLRVLWRVRRLAAQYSSGSPFSFFALAEPHSQHRTSHARPLAEQPWFSRAGVQFLELAC